MGSQTQSSKKNKWKRAHKKPWNRAHAFDIIQKNTISVVGEEMLQAILNIGLQVADVRKPLVSVRRFFEKEDVVRFGPEVDDNYIQNGKTQDEIP